MASAQILIGVIFLNPVILLKVSVVDILSIEKEN